MSSTFFGGRWFDEFAGVMGGLFTFIYVLLLCSMIGLTRALEKKAGSKSAMNIIFLIFTFSAATAAAYGIFRACRWKRSFGAAYLAGLGGMYIGFMLYKWTFQLFLDKIFILAFMVIASAIFCGYWAWRKYHDLVIPITSCIGAICVVRGISILVGGFPESFSSFTGSSNGVLATMYYLMGFILVFVLGFSF
jgi:hypothetical protein